MRAYNISGFTILERRWLPGSPMQAYRHSSSRRSSVMPALVSSILNTYVRAVDEYRRDAIHKLEKLRHAHVPSQEHGENNKSGRIQ